MSKRACRARATSACRWTERRSDRPPLSGPSPDGRSKARSTRKASAPTPQGAAAPYKWRGKHSICARPFRAVVPLRPFDLPRGQASAIAAQRASLEDVTACLCLSLGKENPLAETTPKRLTPIRGSVILWVRIQRRGFRNGDVTGAFFFCLWFSDLVAVVLIQSAHSDRASWVHADGSPALNSS